MQHNRVYVVGMGVVSPLGNSVDTMWQNLLNGVSGTVLNTFSTYLHATGDKELNPAYKELLNLVTAEVKEFNPADWMDRKTIRREDPFCWFALAAAKQAMAHARLETLLNLRRTAVVIGSGIGGLTTLEHEHTTLMQKGPGRVSPFLVPRMMPNAATSIVAREFNCNGPGITPVSACATGADAIGEGYRLIRDGLADIVIAGGAEAVITPVSLAGFRNMEALAKRTDDPARRSRPFDRDRDGFVMGEGAGVMILASPYSVHAYDLTPLAEVAGNARTQDAHHITAPHPEALHATRVIKMALRDASISPDDVVYINPHGTGTQINDPIEALAISNVFGTRTASIPISSSKSMLGHMVGAAGAVESIICVMTILEGKAHPAINLDNIDEKCAMLDHIIGQPRAIPPGAILKISLGFGGSNAALVFLPVS